MTLTEYIKDMLKNNDCTTLTELQTKIDNLNFDLSLHKKEEALISKKNELENHIKVLQELCNEQSLLINACLAEIPVGNYTTHTPQKLPERIANIVSDQCSLYNNEETLCDFLDVDDMEDAIEVVKYMQEKYFVYRDALKTIQEGTEYAQEIANKILGWNDSDEYDIDDLRSENLELKLAIEALIKEDGCDCGCETNNVA